MNAILHLSYVTLPVRVPFLASLGDIIGGGELALLALHRSGPLQMKEFVAASFASFTTASKIRAELEHLQLIEVETISDRGAHGVLKITLTDYGREVAKHLAAASDALERGAPQERKRR